MYTDPKPGRNFKNDARHGRFKVTASNEEMEVVYYTENKKVEEICEEIGSDQLLYQEIPDLIESCT